MAAYPVVKLSRNRLRIDGRSSANSSSGNASGSERRRAGVSDLWRPQTYWIRIRSVKYQLPFFQDPYFAKEYLACNISTCRCGNSLRPALLTRLLPALMISNFHLPAARSPQKCTLMNGQSSNEGSSTSRGRSKSNTVGVPEGEVKLNANNK